MESRIQILDRLAQKWSKRPNCVEVSTFEEWLDIYTPDATVKLVYMAMQEYSKQKYSVLINSTTVDEAGVVAVKICEVVEPKLTAQEETFFIAGFQECLKWLQSNKKLKSE